MISLLCIREKMYSELCDEKAPRDVEIPEYRRKKFKKWVRGTSSTKK